MPLSYAQYAGNGSTTTFSVPFPYILKAHVKVYLGFNILNGTYTSELVDGTGFTWTSGTQIQCTTAPAVGQTLTVIRQTPSSSRLVDWNDGSNLIAADMDTADLQNLYVVQEQQDRNDSGITQSTSAINTATSAAATATAAAAQVATAYLRDGSVAMTGNIAAGGFRLTNAGTPVSATDGATKGYVDGFVSQTANIANSAVTTAKLADSSVTSAKIADGTIAAADLAADSVTTAKILDANITTAKIADQNVTTAKVADLAIATGKLADSAVTTAKIADSNVTTAKIADANVTTTKIADQNVTTGKVADLGITTGKLADGAVTTAKVADGAITNAKLADADLQALAGAQAGAAAAFATLAAGEVSKLSGLTATTAELNKLNGVTANTSEINRLTGLTSSTSELNQLTGKTISGTLTPGNANDIPTSTAVNSWVSNLINALGGFVAIANRNSFPTENPDPSDNAGTVVSIADAGGLVVNASGVATNAQTTGSAAVTISGFPAAYQGKTLNAGLGIQVQTTTTLNTYTFHKSIPTDADIAQLSDDVNDFFARYRIGATNPTTNNDAGDLFFNTTVGKMLVYNGLTSAWEEVQSIGNFTINTLSSSAATGGGSATFDGTAYRFALSNAPLFAQQLLVSVNGVIQRPNSGTTQPAEGYAIDGNDIIFSQAPAASSPFFIVTMGSTVNIGTPSDGTVSTAKLQDASVITAKIASDAVTTTKILDANVTTSKVADGAITTAKIADGTIVDADINAAAAIAPTKIAGTAVITSDSRLSDTRTPTDGTVTTAKIVDGAVTNAKLSGGAAVANIGYTPLNKAGDTVTGTLNFTGGGGNVNMPIRQTYFGYGAGYSVLQIGTQSSGQTISLFVDPSANPGAAFNGNGNELLVPRGFNFITPNSANNSYFNALSFSDGRVLMPSQPYAIVSIVAGNVGSTSNMVSSGFIVPTGVVSNSASMYNSSNGRFTAPVSGLYEMSFNGNVNVTSGTGYVNVSLFLNGSSLKAFYNDKVAPVWQYASGTFLRYLSANDYVQFALNASSGSLGFDPGGMYNYFCVRLVH